MAQELHFRVRKTLHDDRLILTVAYILGRAIPHFTDRNTEPLERQEPWPRLNSEQGKVNPRCRSGGLESHVQLPASSPGASC